MSGPDAATLIPPHDTDVEQTVLGAALLYATAIPQLCESLADEDFYRPTHQQVFAAVRSLHERGEPVDILTVSDESGVDKSTLIGLSNACVTTANLSKHIEMLKKLSLWRRLVAIGTDITRWGFEREDDGASRALELVTTLQDSGKRRAVTLTEAVKERLQDYRKPVRAFSLPGSSVRLHFGDLIILGARPGVGKTALALWASVQWAETHRVSFFSYEMSRQELADRIISATTKVSSECAYDGLSEGQVAAYAEATDCLPKHLRIKECAGMTMGQLITALRMFAAGGGEVAVIDYLQLAVPRGHKMGANEATAMVTNQLMALAKSTGMAIIALSQLSREGAWNNNRDKLSFPQLHQLRDSGAIEQDAAFVCLLSAIPGEGDEESAAGLKYREALRGWKYEVEDTGAVLRADWCKVRHGKTRVEFYHFDGMTMTFRPVEKEPRLVEGTWADLGLDD